MLTAHISDRLVWLTKSESHSAYRAIDCGAPNCQNRLMEFKENCEATMHESESVAPSESLTEFENEHRLQTTAQGPSFTGGQEFRLMASGLAQLLETARRELERDQQAADAALVKAESILKAEIARCFGTKSPAFGGLAVWQAVRVQAYIDSNLHRRFHIRDLCTVARRSQAHFSRTFKLTFGEPPHAYIVRKRLHRACHLMMTTAAPLIEIALNCGFSDQAHLCRHFRQAFGQSPGGWRREMPRDANLMIPTSQKVA